jgi:outer membrane protein OmpA-like peptidoglycan-associated protein
LEILFEYNSARINPESVRQLVTLAEALQDAALQGTRIMIAGHTDASGSNAYNDDLSYRRAQSVSDFLKLYAGISPDRLAIEGYGEELLKYPDAPNSGQNRRVEIINLGA